MHYAGDAVLAKFNAVIDAMASAVAIQAKLKVRNEDVPDEHKVQFCIGVVIEDRGDIYSDGVVDMHTNQQDGNEQAIRELIGYHFEGIPWAPATRPDWLGLLVKSRPRRRGPDSRLPRQLNRPYTESPSIVER